MSQQKKRSYLGAVLQNKCPRCREGNIFISKNAYNLKNTYSMHKTCSTCGQPTEIEVGFYYGTGYVSYALSIAFLIASFIASYVLFGLSVHDNSILWWLIISCILLFLLQPLNIRLSRSLWLSWFVKYDANWKENAVEHHERVNKAGEGNF
ncbi:MAG: DUF983 domain-containing protein [Chitinophagaceae bacterium]|nr:DUF983 domain-containing protein [Chitinophagaceae bacterium]MCW5904245.1 DUF983 domain-containing protein [Chitinophagaceae bacterium]